VQPKKINDITHRIDGNVGADCDQRLLVETCHDGLRNVAELYNNISDKLKLHAHE
jgi:hypothetical protein